MLSRRTFAERLTRVVQLLEAPAVASVSANYGMGKTHFATRWVGHLRNQGKLAIYFNAWETDFARDPLIAFVDALKMPQSIKALRQTKPLRKSAKALGIVAAKIAAKSAMRAATFGVIGDKTDSEIEAALAGGLDQFEKAIEGALDSFTQEKDQRRRLRKSSQNTARLYFPPFKLVRKRTQKSEGRLGAPSVISKWRCELLVELNG